MKTQGSSLREANDHGRESNGGLETGLPRVLGAVCAGALALGIAGLALHNLGNRYFWTDESSSFFTALGWPGPGQQPGGFTEIRQTLSTFLDPGLYHLMTRGWFEVFGGRIEILRSMPFLFFMMYVAALFLWYRRLRLPLIVASAGVAVMMLENITPYYAVEVRAYSASLAAALILPLTASWFAEMPSRVRLALFLAVGAFFGAMQYTAASVNIAVAFLLAVYAIRQRSSQRRRLLIAAVFMALWLPVIYLITRGWPSGGADADLDHVRSIVLRYMEAESVLATLSTNFFTMTALPRTVFLVLVPVLAVTSRVVMHGRSQRVQLHTPARNVTDLWIYVLALTTASALLSFGGFLPWVLGTRWSITEVGGIALSVAGLLVLGRDYVPLSLRQRQKTRITITVVCVALVALGTSRLWGYERAGHSTVLDDLVPVLVSGNPKNPIVIDYWIFPDTRYWVEYSGQFDEWRQEWIERGVVSTSGFAPAGPSEIASFLESPSDRLLLRDDEALRAFGTEFPEGVTVAYPEDFALASPGLTSGPVVLVKGSDFSRPSS